MKQNESIDKYRVVNLMDIERNFSTATVVHLSDGVSGLAEPLFNVCAHVE